MVGGGASGTILAAQLARRGVPNVLIDGSGRIGKGVAYSTTEAVHVLNVRAEAMSAWSGEPDHFATRFEAEGGDRRGFAERRLFAAYLGEMLKEAVASGCTRMIEKSAVSGTVNGDAWTIGFDDDSSIDARALVLATGNQEPDMLSEFRDVGWRFIRNPWGDEARAAIEQAASGDEAVLLVGTGLTMIDLALSLHAAGHEGKIVALARRGLAPRAHADFEPAPVALEEVPKGSVRALSRWLRRRGAQVGWRAAVDSLRPHSHALWQSLGAGEQRRFLRHARPWWDVHRHRIAPEVAATVARMIGEGRLEIVAGRIVSAEETNEGLTVEFRRRGRAIPQSMSFAYAFNCSGPLHSIARSRDPLLRSLLDAGAVRPDHLGIGLEADGTSRAGEHLWAMGPLTKARYWEITAVPDIREQAAAIADDIKRELGK
ncbi:MAG: FAD/NAD(P)-binding protein [Sphingomicrobium sp.]